MEKAHGRRPTDLFLGDGGGELGGSGNGDLGSGKSFEAVSLAANGDAIRAVEAVYETDIGTLGLS